MPFAITILGPSFADGTDLLKDYFGSMGWLEVRFLPLK
jgi:hypothetical protein